MLSVRVQSTLIFLLFNSFQQKSIFIKTYVLVMSEYFIGVSRKFTNSSSRRNPFNRSKNGKVAFYVSESISIRSKRVNTFTYFLYKWFKPRYKRRIAWCTNCENKFQALCKNGKVVIACPNCGE